MTTPPTNHISAADASLAVTALKIEVPPSPTGRRRTVSSCKIEDEEVEVINFFINS